MFLSRCQYQNKKALFTDPIFSEGFALGLKPWKSDESSEKVVKTPQKKPKPKKLFQCGDCDYNNADMKSVNSHIRRLHRKPYKCNKCDYTNPSEKFVLNHIKMSHNPSSQVDSIQDLNSCFQIIIASISQMVFCYQNCSDLHAVSDHKKQ